MFDMSWGEIMVIGGVALIVIGPKDLPKALRTVGQMTTKVRRLASEFQTQFNDAMREAELEDVKKEVAGLNSQVASATSTAFNPIQTIRDELKGAVEAKPVTVGPSSADYGTAEGLAMSSPPVIEPLPPVEDAGPSHHLEPAAVGPAPVAAPEASATNLPTPALTGPGLEAGAEPRPAASARA